MTTTPAELLQDAHEQTHGYAQEVKCEDCGEVWDSYYWEGEPVHDDSLDCHCGGRGEVV